MDDGQALGHEETEVASHGDQLTLDSQASSNEHGIQGSQEIPYHLNGQSPLMRAAYLV